MTERLDQLPTRGAQILTLRASAHAVAGHAAEAEFAYGVSDLDMGALMLMLETGVEVRRNEQCRWYAAENVYGPRSVSAVVGEAIRTGLVTHMVSTRLARHVLVPARVHLTFPVGDPHTFCNEPGEGMGPKRVRLVADPVAVDCVRCLARL